MEERRSAPPRCISSVPLTSDWTVGAGALNFTAFRRSTTTVRALLLSLLLAATAQAETATEALKARDAEIRAALPPQGTEPTAATRQKMESIVTKAVDLEGMATFVPTEVLVKGEPTHVDYRMREEKGAWRIVDIVVDDVSTVENYRSSFNRIIKKEGMDGLIARLNGTGTKRKRRSVR